MELDMNIRVLREADNEKLDAASIRLLERVGVDIPHPEILARFEKAGAKVDTATHRVRIPEPLVRDCLATAGKTFAIGGRDPTRVTAFGAGQRNYNSTAGQATWLDDDGRRRYACLADVVTAAKLGEMLPHLKVVGAMADPHEIPVEYRCVEVAATLLRHTLKPIMFWFHDRHAARFVLELFDAVAGSAGEMARRPFGYPFLEPISPLRFPFHGIDLLFETCRVPLPVPIGPMVQMGMSGPCTVAGAMGVENAEILAGVCVVQLIRPGTPVCYGGIPHAFDMRTTQIVFDGPEAALIGVAMTQMGKYYGLPVYVNAGMTDSKTPDAQAGCESGATLAYAALAGADIFGHFGICGADQGASPDMLVLQNEIIGYVERIMAGVVVDDESLALELVEEVGPGGTFVDQPHTVNHMRREVWMPRVFERDYFTAWEQRGGKTAADRAREYRNELLAAYQPCPLPDDVEREVGRILAAARTCAENSTPAPP
jgi:trimethylamine--corrinoid protein Co-methyltransferase